MKLYTMPNMTTTMRNGTKLTIPGGWLARVPILMDLDEQTKVVYGKFYQSQGAVPSVAETKVLEAMNSVFTKNWVRYLAISVRYWARKYAQRYPHNVYSNGTLRGFRPELMQNTYIPQSRTGKSIPYVNELFRKMNADG